jgi:hypothetical protein
MRVSGFAAIQFAGLGVIFLVWRWMTTMQGHYAEQMAQRTAQPEKGPDYIAARYQIKGSEHKNVRNHGPPLWANKGLKHENWLSWVKASYTKKRGASRLRAGEADSGGDAAGQTADNKEAGNTASATGKKTAA